MCGATVKVGAGESVHLWVCMCVCVHVGVYMWVCIQHPGTCTVQCF